MGLSLNGRILFYLGKDDVLCIISSNSMNLLMVTNDKLKLLNVIKNEIIQKRVGNILSLTDIHRFADCQKVYGWLRKLAINLMM